MKYKYQLLFGKDDAPSVDISLNDLLVKAQESAGQMSVSGVQPKLSVIYDKKNHALDVVGHGGTYILKPQVTGYVALPENEDASMDMAQAVGIDVPPHALVRLTDGTWAYLVKRFDRLGDGQKRHQEDFAQILQARNKYRGSVEQICNSLFRHARVPGLAVQLFLERVVFNFIIGNGDAHLKNYSVQYDKDGRVDLAPAYDLIASRLVIASEAESAIAINGKKNNLARIDFEQLAEKFDVPLKVLFGAFEGKQDVLAELIKSSMLPEDMQRHWLDLIAERMSVLGLR